jgi:hypothetical protein
LALGLAVGPAVGLSVGLAVGGGVDPEVGAGVAVAAGGGVGVAPLEPIVRVVVASKVPVLVLAETRPPPRAVVAGIGIAVLKEPAASAVKVASTQPLIVRFPVWAAAKPLPDTAICVPGAACAGTVIEGTVVAAAATIATVEVASKVPAGSLAEMRPVPMTAQLGITTETENAPLLDAVKVVTNPPL